MNALIFAAGLGTRLKPLTDTMPKAMVPVSGKPLLQHTIERLQSVGATDIVVNVHHFADQIRDFITGNGYDIKVSDETDMLLETGGGIKKAARLFGNGDMILTHNVDILSNANLRQLYDNATFMQHAIAMNVTSPIICSDPRVVGDDPHPVLGAMMLVSQRKTQRYLIFDNDSNLVGWTNIQTGQIKSPYPDLMEHDGEIGYFDYLIASHPDGSHLPIEGERGRGREGLLLAFSGIQVFNPEILPLMDAFDGKFSIIDFYLSICDKVHIKCQLDDRLSLLDVGKLDSIAQAEQFLQNNI